MPVNVDTVYQTVQALANKEQRGYLTPQEFNLFANQAQHDIFEQYFYDLTAFKLRNRQLEVGEGYAVDGFGIGNSVTDLIHKIQNTVGITFSSSVTVTGGITLPNATHVGRIFATSAGGVRKTLRKIDPDEIHDLRGSKWHREKFTEFVYFDDGYGKIQVWSGFGQVFGGITCESIVGRLPLVYWGYIVVNEDATYNPATSSDFGLHISEQSDLVIKILKLAGVSIEDTQLAGIAAQEDQLNLQQENK